MSLDISTLNKTQLKDIIRANDWDDKPSLTVSEAEMEKYLQSKIDSGDLVFGNIKEETPVSAEEVIEEAAKEASVQQSNPDPEPETSDERIVEVAVVQKIFLESGVPTMPEFDADGIAITKAKLPLSQAKVLEKAGKVQIRG